MLVIQPSTSLARRLKIVPDHIAPRHDDHPMAEWCARDFRIGTGQFVLFMNSMTTLPIILEVAPYKTLLERFCAFLPGYLSDLGWSQAREALDPILAAGTEYRKGNDRSNTGIMNQFLYDLEWACKSGRLSADSPMDMTRRLSETLIGGSRPGGYKYPLERFREWAGYTTTVRRRLELVRQPQRP